MKKSTGGSALLDMYAHPDINVYLNAPLDLDKICRACLNTRSDMKPLYGACMNEMITSFAQIEIAEDDGFPSLLCVQCILQCSRAYTFKTLCQKSDYILREYLKPEFQEKLAKHQEAAKRRRDFQDTHRKAHEEQAQQKAREEEEEEAKQRAAKEAGGGDVLQTIDDPSLASATSVEVHEIVELQQLSDAMKVELGAHELLAYDAENEQYYTVENVAIVHQPLDETLDAITAVDEQTGEAYKIEMVDAAEQDDSAAAAVTVADDFLIEQAQTDDGDVDIGVNVSTSTTTSGPHICRVCGKQFAEARILRRHAKIHLECKPHRCTECDMSFAESSNLSKHKKKHTGELRNIQGKPHLCSVCGRAFKWASSLSKHTKYHTGHKLYTCHYCGKQYVEARSLKIHLRAHTGERPHACVVCDKTFTQICNLEKHLRVHTGEKPYQCPVCGKTFTQSGYIAIHMRTHTGEKPYRCDTCGKAFAGSNTLAIHMRTHTGEKPHACSVCPRRFGRKETLAAHLATHVQDENALDCPVCFKRFTNQSSLKMHQRTHAAQIYFCKNCGFQASSNEAIQEHMNIMHAYNAEETVGEDQLKVLLNVGVDGVQIQVQTLEDDA